MRYVEVGQVCVLMKDGYDEPLISPRGNQEYVMEGISEEEFWRRSIITEYLKNETDICRKNIYKITCFWDKWNNGLHAIEFENGEFCAIRLVPKILHTLFLFASCSRCFPKNRETPAAFWLGKSGSV